MVNSNRKPHLLRVKRRIVALLDAEIDKSKTGVTTEERRELAIFIRQRNKIAKDADMPPIELTQKDGTGMLIYTTGN